MDHIDEYFNTKYFQAQVKIVIAQRRSFYSATISLAPSKPWAILEEQNQAGRPLQTPTTNFQATDHLSFHFL